MVNLQSGASHTLAAAGGVHVSPLVVANVAAILPDEAAVSVAGAVGRVTDLLVLTAVGGWLGGADGTTPYSWSLLRLVTPMHLPPLSTLGLLPQSLSL